MVTCQCAHKVSRMHPRLSLRRIAIAFDGGIFSRIREALVQVADIAAHDEFIPEALRDHLGSIIREIVDAMDTIDPTSDEGRELTHKVATALSDLKPYLQVLNERAIEAARQLQSLPADP